MLLTVLAAPAWSEEPAPRPLDLRGELIRKIVRDTAATQFAAVNVSPDEPAAAEHRPIEFVPATKVTAPPPPKLPPASPGPSDFVSTLFDALFDVALGTEPDYSYAARYDDWLRCQSRDNLRTTRERAASCPRDVEDSLIPIATGNSSDFPITPAP
jgi:hypothetical protein